MIQYSKPFDPFTFPDMTKWNQAIEESLQKWVKVYPLSELTLVSGEPSDAIKSKCLQHFKLVTIVNDQEIVLDEKWLLKVKELHLPEERPQETSFTDQELLDIIKMAFDLGNGQPKDDGPFTMDWPMRILRHVKAAKTIK
ncbi:MAG TPA: hypothetical protein V6C65_26250 [Allocoleopsis sp.]